jgi:NAD(P)-dependent dehydrogenase (short-subunit alcohol dehydrogenase family)
MSKKVILCFGANSFIANSFFEEFEETYSFVKVYRSGKHSLLLDFNYPDEVIEFSKKIDFMIDGVIFFQGANPEYGIAEIDENHFMSMLKINLITPTIILQQLIKKININASVIFFSSVAKRKGSYDPSYAAAKSGISGLIQSLANSIPNVRFNSISLGLVSGSPVEIKMSDDFKDKHKQNMYMGKLIATQDVSRAINELIINNGLHRTEICLEGGFK